MRVDPETLHEQARSVLTAWGQDEEAARVTATVMVDTDLAGIDSHGVSMLPTYDRLRERGVLQVTAIPRTLRDTVVTALMDAGGGLGHPVALLAMRQAVEKARAHGLGAVAVRNSRHFGAAGFYARMAAEQGLIGLVTSSARTLCVTPTRGAVPRLATNPLAFAAPAGDGSSFLLDMATSTAAMNKVKVHSYDGQQLPAGWVLDESGEPVRDPERALTMLRSGHTAGLTPLGGTAEMASHKGYGLAVMVQLLSTTLSGTAPPAEGEDAADVGHFFLAMDPGAFGLGPRDFEAATGELLGWLRAAPAIDTSLPVLVAGDREAASREERTANGIPMSEALRQELRDVSLRAGVNFLLE